MGEGTAGATSARAEAGMVCSVDHVASRAGLDVLRAGGSAADAAVAAGAVLAVTAPHLCGTGGDLFAVVYVADGRPGRDPGAGPAVLNASGRAGSGADPHALRRQGHRVMPLRGDVRSVTVPGCVDGWLALHGRFGVLALERVLAPAVDAARHGFPASPTLVASLAALATGAATTSAGATELFAGAPPRAVGETARRPALAADLEAIVAGGRDGFYRGPVGTALVELGAGLFSAADLGRVQADWVAPLGHRVWGHDVWTVPPNSQGYLTLLGAAIAQGLDLPADWRDPAWAHLLIESARVAGHDRPDVLHEHARVAATLAGAEVARRRAAVDPARRSPLPAPATGGGTTAVAVVDGSRMGVSLIQSNASGFGAHLFPAGTGIGLHNRGIGFSLRPGHPAELGPRRRPPHTLAPVLVTAADGSLRAVLGTMGGDSQPQILLQLLCRVLHHGSGAAAAVAAPRWVLRRRDGTGFDTWDGAGDVAVAVEDGVVAGWAEGLARRGHEIVTGGVAGAGRATGHGFGHAQLVLVEPDGSLAGAADPRAVAGLAAGC